MAMTLRTGKGGRYRYYTCSTKARQGETGCRGRTVPMKKLDTLVPDHIEQRLLQPSRLEKILSSVLDRREERIERQATHIAELRKRATEADAKLKRLYGAIENGVTDLSDLMLKDRITVLKAIRDQARADTERAEGAINRQGPTITTQSIKTFARTPASECAPRAAAIGAIISARLPNASKSTRKNLASWCRKAYSCVRSSLLQAQKTAGFGVPSSVPKWRTRHDSNVWPPPSEGGALSS
jgi:site-specific DNA recombinase